MAATTTEPDLVEIIVGETGDLHRIRLTPEARSKVLEDMRGELDELMAELGRAYNALPEMTARTAKLALEDLGDTLHQLRTTTSALWYLAPDDREGTADTAD